MATELAVHGAKEAAALLATYENMLHEIDKEWAQEGGLRVAGG